MIAYITGVPTRYKVACVCDALVLPVLLLLWYRLSHPTIAGGINADVHQHAGLFASAVMMIVFARAALKVEQAIRSPQAYRWDLERALRWVALLVIMALAVRFTA